ncbi:hypothetical protein ACFLWU_00260 [Chloroflexota bacterium]
MTKPQVIREGYYVAICLVSGTAPQCCYIGMVTATDEYGVRINPVHWDDKLDVVAVNTEDLYVPWENIDSMLVCTPEHPTRRFLRDRAPQWRTEIESMRKAESKASKKE